jgi:CRISPR-associated protein Cst1
MFGNRHTNLLGPAITEFPNGYWNLSQTSYTCPLCAFLLVHHHLAFSRLHDGTEVFVNAPSFRLMLDLNRIVGGQLGVSSGEGASSKREILAMSVIEYSSKVNATLGIWMGMNLEVVIRRRERVGTSGNPKKDFDDVIEFFSLPYETTMILADRGIATTLKQIGDFRVLNLVLNRQYKKIVEDAHRLMKISLKNELSDFDWNYLNGHFIFRLKKRLDDREKEFLLRKARVTAQNMLRLYALIEPKTNVGGTS